jgi:hypothetical protein
MTEKDAGYAVIFFVVGIFCTLVFMLVLRALPAQIRQKTEAYFTCYPAKVLNTFDDMVVCSDKRVLKRLDSTEQPKDER